MGGTAQRVNVLAAEDFSYAITDEEKPHIVLAPPEFSYAPVIEGQAAGYAYICIGEKTVGKVPVVYEETIEQSVPQKKSFWENWFGGRK